ncbi:MAG: ATP-binding protein [Verrucomicrobiota bacterium]
MKRQFKYLVLLLFAVIPLVTLSLQLHAAELYNPTVRDPLEEPWRFKHEEILNGIGANCMAEARNGLMWFGCSGGLIRYDGRKTDFIPLSSNILEDIKPRSERPTIKEILIIEKGILALTNYSLVLYKDNNWRVIVQDTGASPYHSLLLQAPDQNIWLQTSEALWLISPDLENTWRVIDTTPTLPLLAMCLDPSGDIWVVQKIAKLKSQFIRIPVKTGLPKEESDWKIYDIPYKNIGKYATVAADHNGHLYYGDREPGTKVELFDPTSNQWLPDEGDYPWLGLNKLLKAEDGTIWGGMNGEVYRIDNKGKRTLYSRQQLQLPKVPFKLHKTKNNRLWILSHVNQIYSIDIGTDEWLTYEKLNFQCESDSGVQWFLTTGNRIVSHNAHTKKWLLYDNKDHGLEQITVLLASSHGLLWAAGSHKGEAAISTFDGEKWTIDQQEGFARSISPKSAFEATDGTIWFGAGDTRLSSEPLTGGAIRYKVLKDNKVQFLAHYQTPSLPHSLYSIAQSDPDTILIGSDGLYTLSLKTASTELIKPYLEEGNKTVDLLLDENEHLWIGTETHGIYQVTQNQQIRYMMGDNLAGHKLVDLLGLQDRSILVSTDQGASRFDGVSWTSQVYPKSFAMTEHLSRLGQGHDGSIWFSFSRREVKSALDLISNNRSSRSIRHRPESNPPDTFITTWLEHVSPPGNCHIEWSAVDFESMTPSSKLQYSWRLDGLNWSAFSNKKGKTFVNLKHGDHVLEVRSRDLAFNIDPTPAKISFFVEPPLWLQPWFTLLILLLTGAATSLVWIWFYYHEKRLKDRAQHLEEMDRIKTSFHMNLSHELMTPLTVIKGPLDDLEQIETDRNKLDLISMAKRSADRISTLVTQLLYFRKLEQGKLTLDLVKGNFNERVQEAVNLMKPLIDRHQLHCQLRAKDTITGLIDKDKLEKILTNLIHNAIKYTSPGGTILIKLETKLDKSNKEKRLTLSVEDDGVGVEKQHLENIFNRFYRASSDPIIEGSGIGLNLTKELVELWGGRVYAESPIREHPDKPGARFVVELPLLFSGHAALSKKHENLS